MTPFFHHLLAKLGRRLTRSYRVMDSDKVLECVAAGLAQRFPGRHKSEFLTRLNAEVDALSIRELKGLIIEGGLGFSDCCEKSELRARGKEALAICEALAALEATHVVTGKARSSNSRRPPGATTPAAAAASAADANAAPDDNFARGLAVANAFPTPETSAQTLAIAKASFDLIGTAGEGDVTEIMADALAESTVALVASTAANAAVTATAAAKAAAATARVAIGTDAAYGAATAARVAAAAARVAAFAAEFSTGAIDHSAAARRRRQPRGTEATAHAAAMAAARERINAHRTGVLPAADTDAYTCAAASERAEITNNALWGAQDAAMYAMKALQAVEAAADDAAVATKEDRELHPGHAAFAFAKAHEAKAATKT